FVMTQGRAIPYRSNPEGCTRGLTSAFWECLPTTKLYESRARATLENLGQISTALFCGDNAEIGLRALADGRFAELVCGRCQTAVCAAIGATFPVSLCIALGLETTRHQMGLDKDGRVSPKRAG